MVLAEIGVHQVPPVGVNMRRRKIFYVLSSCIRNGHVVAPENLLVQQVRFASSLCCGCFCVLDFGGVCDLVGNSSDMIQRSGRNSQKL